MAESNYVWTVTWDRDLDGNTASKEYSRRPSAMNAARRRSIDWDYSSAVTVEMFAVNRDGSRRSMGEAIYLGGEIETTTGYMKR